MLASARKESDTKKFVNVVFADIDHKLTDLSDFEIAPYNYLNKYPGNDNFLKVIAEILNHRIIVFATPVYWYAMSGLMKTFFDRLNDLVTSQKPLGRKLKGKVIFLLAVGSDEELPIGFEIPFQSTAQYFHMAYGGSIYQSTKKSTSQSELASRVRQFIDKITES